MSRTKEKKLSEFNLSLSISEKLSNCHSLNDLRNLYDEINNYIKYIDEKIDSIPDDKMTVTNIYKYKNHCRIETVENKDLYELSEERYTLTKIKENVYEEIIKKKRASISSYSQKALNHGGIYDFGYLELPKVGQGFRGYKGITL